jgi:hypothetical protein
VHVCLSWWVVFSPVVCCAASFFDATIEEQLEAVFSVQSSLMAT